MGWIDTKSIFVLLNSSIKIPENIFSLNNKKKKKIEKRVHILKQSFIKFFIIFFYHIKR